MDLAEERDLANVCAMVAPPFAISTYGDWAPEICADATSNLGIVRQLTVTQPTAGWRQRTGGSTGALQLSRASMRRSVGLHPGRREASPRYSGCRDDGPIVKLGPISLAWLFELQRRRRQAVGPQREQDR
jgi:hypothetical protein